jgi:hypothetical protein
VNCHGVSRAFGHLGRSSRAANHCALEVQNAQSPSKISQGTSRTTCTPSTYRRRFTRPDCRKLG